jgi:hypothetical protein
LRTCCCLPYLLLNGFPSIVNNSFANVFSNFSLLLLVFQMPGVAVVGLPADFDLPVVVGSLMCCWLIVNTLKK